jgi:hypothetical protein
MNSKGFLAFSAISLTLACAGQAKADPDFKPMQFVTYSQNDWGSGAVAPSLLSADYDAVFTAENEVLIVGSVSPGLYNLAFTSASNVTDYLPTVGTPAPLTTSLTNPTSSSSGGFGGDVVALTLNVDFSATGFLHGASSIPFGNLLLTNFSGGLSGLDGLTVSQFLAVANTCLGDGSCPYGLYNVATITDDLNFSFESGTPSAFADYNLALPATPTPEPSTLLLLGSGLASLGFLRRRFLRAQERSHT